MTIDNRLSAEVSRALNESLYGTIKPTDVFFLLEYNGTYTSEAWRDSEIPQRVKAKLTAFPNSHSLLIRQPGQAGEDDGLLTLFVIHAEVENPVLYRLNVPDYEAILEIDFDRVLRGDIAAAQSEPLYTVCTNGRRDRSCSMYGVALYNRLTPLVGDTVWQSSHIGGHRLAATMYCFPHAICYGFLAEDDAPQVVEAYREGRLLLHKWRGRATSDKPMQAAEYFLRRDLNEARIAAVRMVEYTQGEGQWSVCFDVMGIMYRVQVVEAAPLLVLSTTGDATYSPVPQFKYIGYERLS